MADNINVTEGVGRTIAADDIGGILWQRIKMCFGVDGVATDVSASNPLPTIDAAQNTLLGTIATAIASMVTALIKCNTDAVSVTAVSTQSSVSSQLVVLTTANTIYQAAAASAFNGFNYFADSANVDTIWMGGPTVTSGTGVTTSNATCGRPIIASGVGFVQVKNANELYFRSATANQKIYLFGT